MPKFLLLVSFLCFQGLCHAQTVAPGATAGELPDAPHSESVGVLTAGFRRTGFFDAANGLPASRPPVSRLPAPASLVGLRLTLKLINPVTSKMPTGTKIQARLERALAQHGDLIVPEGTLFEGHLATKPAGPFMRPGSMLIVFDRLVLANGEEQGVNLSLVSSDSPNVRSDAEGRLHPTINKKRLAIQLGGTALTAKLADDLAELAGGTAVGAGTARFIGAGAAATFFALQKGREVKLNAGDELNVEFGRAADSLGGSTRLGN
ncbi:MAG TPA: hypothetical protein VJS37_15075 [Terriglobales bacterium]|nr:hypothetical protein [Terriglobales bacterium]